MARAAQPVVERASAEPEGSRRHRLVSLRSPEGFVDQGLLGFLERGKRIRKNDLRLPTPRLILIPLALWALTLLLLV